jgi:hypothetical protein
MAKGSLSAPGINGAEYSWSNIQFFIGGAPIFGITAINYEETGEKEDLYGVGAMPVARIYKNHGFTGSIVLQSKELLSLQQAARAAGNPDGDITTLGVAGGFECIVSYVPWAGQGLPVVDILKNVEFTNNGRSLSQNGGIETEISLIIGDIEWGKL